MFTEATGNCKRFISNRFVEFLLNFFSRIFFCSDDLQKNLANMSRGKLQKQNFFKNLKIPLRKRF